MINEAGNEYGLVTYGLTTQDADKILSWLASPVLKAIVHFCPDTRDVSPGFLIKDMGSHYLP